MAKKTNKDFDNPFSKSESSSKEAKQAPQKTEKKSAMLDKIKATKQEYQAVRIKQEIYNEFDQIAEERGFTYTGRIINNALEHWLEMYRQEKES